MSLETLGFLVCYDTKFIYIAAHKICSIIFETSQQFIAKYVTYCVTQTLAVFFSFISALIKISKQLLA